MSLNGIGGAQTVEKTSEEDAFTWKDIVLCTVDGLDDIASWEIKIDYSGILPKVTKEVNYGRGTSPGE